MSSHRRIAILLSVALLAILLPLPQVTDEGVREYRISSLALPIAFAEDDGDGDIWVSEPLEVEATTVGFSWEPGSEPDGLAWVRSSADGGDWSDWVAVSVDDVHAPDPGSVEAAGARPASSPVFIGDDSHVQFRVEAAAAPDMSAELISTSPKATGLVERLPIPALRGAEASVSRPAIVRRSQWDPSNQCAPRRSPSVARDARVMFVHHTVNPNNYSAARAREMVLNICLYHRNTRGWSDIGYNFLVDRYGAIYEGRAGGMDRAVVGAHTGGYNSGSFGVSFLGTHSTTAPTSAARNALVSIGAWKMDVHDIDPYGRSSINGRTFNNVSGHRDAGSTSCPGNACYQLLDWFRARIFERQVNFTDIAGSAHRRDIGRIAAAGITRGCNPPTNDRFCPGTVVTREQMAAFLARAFDLQATSGRTFTDVPRGSTFAQDIDRLATAGITMGCNPPSNTRFCPNDPVSRDQMAAFMTRAMDATATSSAGSFTDVPWSHTFRRDINQLATAGVTRGCNPPTNSRYCPDAPVTREQMASFLARGVLD